MRILRRVGVRDRSMPQGLGKSGGASTEPFGDPGWNRVEFQFPVQKGNLPPGIIGPKKELKRSLFDLFGSLLVNLRSLEVSGMYQTFQVEFCFQIFRISGVWIYSIFRG